VRRLRLVPTARLSWPQILERTLPAAAIAWFGLNVAFYCIGGRAIGWASGYQAWAYGFVRFPIIVKDAYASIGGAAVLGALVGAIGVAAVVGRRRLELAIVALTATIVVITRTEATVSQAAFAYLGTPVAIAGIVIAGGAVTLRGVAAVRFVVVSVTTSAAVATAVLFAAEAVA